MDQKPNKPNSGSSSSPIVASSNSKTKVAPKGLSYTYDIDLPPSDDNDDNYASEEELPEAQQQSKYHQRSTSKPFEISISEKKLKQSEKKNILAAYAVEQEKQEALKDDHDTFIVVINGQTPVFDGDDEVDANIKI